MGMGAASLAAVMLLLVASVRKEMGHRLLYASTEAVQKACASGDAPDWCRVSGALVFWGHLPPLSLEGSAALPGASPQW